MESLRWLERRAEKSDVGAHLVQVVDEPDQVIVFKVFLVQGILLLVQHIMKLIAEIG